MQEHKMTCFYIGEILDKKRNSILFKTMIDKHKRIILIPVSKVNISYEINFYNDFLHSNQSLK